LRVQRGAALALIVSIGLGAGCSSQTQAINVQLPAANGQSGPMFDVSSCAHYTFDILDRACSIDSNGKTYPVDGHIWILPAAPPYAAFFLFQPGYVPLPQDLDATSNNPSIGVMAAPASPTLPCCPDPSITLRPPVQVTMVGERGLLVTITDPVPVGDEVRMGLYFGPLFKDLVDPCMLPNPAVCTQTNNSSFGMGFDVGSGPGGGPPPPADAGPPPAGACLLEYNGALATGDPCCYRQGGKNTCDRSIKCNDASGTGCCLIYGTENTAGGGRCCLYEGGQLGDDPAECSVLLAQSR
jgi:hypothetical protein